MDGQKPSGFTNSEYKGMTYVAPPPAPTPKPEPEPEVEIPDEPKTVVEFFITIFKSDDIIGAIIAICWLYPQVCFNPFFWFTF